jgi:hypothetical protein
VRVRSIRLRPPTAHQAAIVAQGGPGYGLFANSDNEPAVYGQSINGERVMARASSATASPTGGHRKHVAAMGGASAQ